MAQLFGTDGVRGKAGEYPLDSANGAAAGRGAGSCPAARRRGVDRARFLAGRDTRESGAWIERELAYGVASRAAADTSAGVVPTPAVAYLTPRSDLHAGVVISASHNPFEDNGIKVFSGARREVHRSARAAGRGDRRRPVVDGRGRARPAPCRAGRLSLRVSRAPARDPASQPCAPRACASPSTAPTARRRRWRRALFQRAGVRRASSSAIEPDGRNINLALRLDRSRSSSRGLVVEGGYATGRRVRRRRRPRDLRRRSAARSSTATR